MDLGEIFRVIRRRWYVMLTGFVVAIALTVGAYSSTPTKYQSQGTIALLNSKLASQVGANGGNPYLSFGSNLNIMADFLVRSLNSATTGQALAAQGVTEQYSAALAPNALGPFINLSVTGPDRAHVLQSADVLAAYASQALQNAQAGAPAASLIRTTTIVPPQPATPQTKSKVQYTAGAAVIGLVLMLLATFVTENIIAGRRRKAAASSDAGTLEAGPLEPGTPADESLPPVVARAAETWAAEPAPNVSEASPHQPGRRRGGYAGYDPAYDADPTVQVRMPRAGSGFHNK